MECGSLDAETIAPTDLDVVEMVICLIDGLIEEGPLDPNILTTMIGARVGCDVNTIAQAPEVRLVNRHILGVLKRRTRSDTSTDDIKLILESEQSTLLQDAIFQE
jgi:hypothetical protein